MSEINSIPFFVDNITIIGLGLIGGSLAIALKEKNLTKNIVGVDSNILHQQKALELGFVDQISDLQTGIEKADLIILAIPVNAAEKLLPFILQQVKHQVVMDVGSTKHSICAAVDGSEYREQFVATHPMWGTEFSGPEAAVSGAFANKAVVICNKNKSSEKAVLLVEALYKNLGMHILYMDADAHDIHTAYISHISHISSFALANTVLEKEREDGNIFELASAGFESTVRLAKSNVETWVPIFQQNKENVLDVLNEHISQLRKFKNCLEKDNYEYLAELIGNANKIKRILQ